jgi:Protein of unknown function (DUF3313)
MKEKKMRTGNILSIAMMVVLSFAVWGCSTKTMQPYKDSGFLPDYSRLEPVADNREARLWTLPFSEREKYNKVILERIVVSIGDEAEYKAIDPTEMKALVDYFHEAIVKALGDAYPVVTEPGPDVLRIKIALTQLVPTQTAISVIVLVVPYGSAADLMGGAVGKGGFGSAPYLGDAAVEAMGLDSVTNELVFEYVERRIGKKYDIDASKGAGEAVSTGVSTYMKAYTQWGYTKQAMDYWAQRLRQKFDEIHGKKPAKT